MGWEQRERGGLYYTRSKKVNGRVVREYVGTGPLAELIAQKDALERRRHEEEATAWAAEKERLEALEAPVVELCEITEALARATLVARGYRQHKRGEWRRRRVSPKKKEAVAGTPAKTDRAPKETLPKKKEDLIELVERAGRGDETTLPALRELLDFEPELVSAWGDLARKAERELLEVRAGNNLRTKEAVQRKLRAMETELAGLSPSPLEKLLVERVAACWLQLHWAEVIYAQNLGSLTMTQSEYHQRCLDRMHRRYLSSIKTLAQIRKLGPPVQINIAEKQINTAG